MKKSELKKLIREILSEQIAPQNIQVAPASSLIINDSNLSIGGSNPGGGYSIRCPQGYRFEGFMGDTNPGNLNVDAANTPFSTFINPVGNPMFLIDRCIKMDKAEPLARPSGGVEALRPDKDTQTLTPASPSMRRPSPEDPLEEIVKKISKKLKNKK